jgi:hypothetical protein
MGCQIAGNRDEDVPALVRVAPRAELPHSRFQHLIRMETCIFAQHRMRERGDQRVWRMAECEMPCHQPCGEIDLSLAVEGVQQGGADCLWIRGQIVQLLAAIARDARRRHIEAASKVERDCSVQYAADGPDVSVDIGSPDPRQHLVNGVGVGEDVMRRLPVGVLVGIAEARHPERGRVREGLAKISRSGTGADRLLERINDFGRIVTEQLLSKCGVADQLRKRRPAANRSASLLVDSSQNATRSTGWRQAVDSSAPRAAAI